MVKHVTKVEGPKEDPETAARREEAEQRADATRVDATKRDLDHLTQELIRTFGRRKSLGGLAGGFTPPGATGSPGSPGDGTTPGISDGGQGGGSYDPGFGLIEINPETLGLRI